MKQTKLSELTLMQRKALYKKAKDAYYNSDRPIMTDAQFDRLEDSLKRDAPDWAGLKAVGAPQKKFDAELPVYMSSLNKMYEADVPRFIEPTADYVETPKLDGTALLAEYRFRKLARLYTRGDGTVGGDISHLIPHLNIPANIKFGGTTTHVRCEGVMQEKAFKARHAEKFANARAAVNGLCNRTSANVDKAAFADIDVVCLAVVGATQAEGLTNARASGFKTLPYKVRSGKALTAKHMSAVLGQIRKAAPYRCDGVVYTKADAKMLYQAGKNPAYACAFKENPNDAKVRATVKSIIWQISSYGRYTPKIVVAPVDLGVNVQHATAHNARWMVDRGIGPGAVVELVRAGDVIPKIVGVVKRGRTSMPSAPHAWKGVHVYAADGNDDAARQSVLKMLRFFRKLGCEGIADASLAKIYAAGYKNPIMLFAATGAEHRSKWVRVLGPSKAGELASIVDGLRRTGIPMANLLVASSCFDEGLGTRRITALAEAIPLNALLHAEPQSLHAAICRIHGFSGATADLIIRGVPKYRKLHALLSKHVKIQTPKSVTRATPKKTGGKYSGMLVSFTGYRSKEQEAAITAEGGQIIDLGSRTTHLLYNPEGRFMDKVWAARDRGVKICTWPNLR